MIKIAIIGSGNVAQHLIKAIEKSADLILIQVYARNKINLLKQLDSERICTNLNSLKNADLYIIAVSDNAITSVSEQLPFKNKLVVHTSGALPLSIILEKNRRGVFYPVQTFSKNKKIDFKKVPLCLETENNTDFELLQKVAKSISNMVFSINFEQRKALHIAAVFVNNFVNCMYQIGETICTENNVSFDILKPLIKETANKINTLPPVQAQTGPAKRGDTKTITAHKMFLKNKKQADIYKLITQFILNNEKKL